MMSRIKAEWVWLAIAAALMVAVPSWLLTGEPDNIPEAQPLLITKVQNQQIAAVDTLLAKPIFNAERKPLADRMPVEESEVEQMPEQDTPAPTLVGVVSKKRGKAVAIVKTNDGETKTLTAGQSSNGWRLVSVGKNDATFANASEQRTVGLDYGNKAIGGPSGAPAPTPETEENPEQPENNLSDGEPN
ncbi:hypothetical protein GCM10009096_00490 [Parasphingorhabdus litoris]|uniref:Type II secretion system protein GspC N-terminal domain-containing protein n=1 Tax=Parasphingorhabdus litoris TaxID=394733 RepID=A0ABP3JTF9_9SPHN|nr:hypothetical protein [Parasphingorhabdus litoris]